MIINNKYLAFFNPSDGTIYSLEFIELGEEINDYILELFKQNNNINEEVTFKYFSQEEYDNVYEPSAENNFYIDIKNFSLKAHYKHHIISHSSNYLWNDMNPQRPYTQKQVEEMYNNDYISCNLKNVLTHPDKQFRYAFLPISKLKVTSNVATRNWDTYFHDPFLNEYSDDKLKLAQSIMKDGTYYPIQVIENEDQETYMVKEGNHRIISLLLGQANGIVPIDYKILCIILPLKLNSTVVTDTPEILSCPFIGRYNVDPLWSTYVSLNPENYQAALQSAIADGDTYINEYTLESPATTLRQAYQYIYIYPLFLRDLLYKYPGIHPSPILNNEKLFLEWLANEKKE